MAVICRDKGRAEIIPGGVEAFARSTQVWVSRLTFGDAVRF